MNDWNKELERNFSSNLMIFRRTLCTYYILCQETRNICVTLISDLTSGAWVESQRHHCLGAEGILTGVSKRHVGFSGRGFHLALPEWLVNLGWIKIPCCALCSPVPSMYETEQDLCVLQTFFPTGKHFQPKTRQIILFEVNFC